VQHRHMTNVADLLARKSGALWNRTSLGSNTYGWDCLNRMSSLNSSAYAYRADGMRVSKAVAGVTTRYRYDGQMSKRSGDPEAKTNEQRESGGMEDVTSSGKVTQYGLGARGIDYMQNPAPTGGWVAFPVYDGHGNPDFASLHAGPGGMVATLARSGSNSYALGNQRSFDAWGSVRLGSQTGDPSGRYCGNLGHKQDDESGLIYMRARYYEPTSGRFISEDPDRNRRDWFGYANSDPASNGDRTGRDAEAIIDALVTYGWGGWLGGGVLSGGVEMSHQRSHSGYIYSWVGLEGRPSKGSSLRTLWWNLPPSLWEY